MNLTFSNGTLKFESDGIQTSFQTTGLKRDNYSKKKVVKIIYNIKTGRPIKESIDCHELWSDADGYNIRTHIKFTDTYILIDVENDMSMDTRQSDASYTKCSIKIPIDKHKETIIDFLQFLVNS